MVGRRKIRERQLVFFNRSLTIERKYYYTIFNFQPCQDCGRHSRKFSNYNSSTYSSFGSISSQPWARFAIDRVEAALGRNETLLTGEEVSFYWMDNDDLYILHNGDVFDVINFPFLNRSFLEIFVGRGTNIISRELYRSVIDRLPTIEDT